MFLHFLHALINDRERVQVFLFGTRLTNVTRELARSDVDEAMNKVAGAVKDWAGGTRIGAALHEFNYHWARRVLTQGAHLLLMTDGLDRDDTGLLGAEMKRLRLSARRIIWLNPLLRYQGFEPRAAGIRAIMPYVDEFRPVHSLDSLSDLARALAGPKSQAHDPGPLDASRASSLRRPEMADPAATILEQANDWLSEGRKLALATVIETWGSAPQPVGSQLVIDEEGNFIGSVSGGCVEGAVVTEAIDAIASGKPKVLAFGVADETAWQVGLACGGKIRIYVEPLVQ